MSWYLKASGIPAPALADIEKQAAAQLTYLDPAQKDQLGVVLNLIRLELTGPSDPAFPAVAVEAVGNPTKTTMPYYPRTVAVRVDKVKG